MVCSECAAGFSELWGDSVSKMQRARDRGEGMQCPFFLFSWSCRRRAESMSAHTHTHTHTHTRTPKASFAGIPTADIRCCKLPFLLRSFSCCSLWFLAGIYVAHSLVASPPRFVFALDWDERSWGHTLLFFPFCLSLSLQHESIHPSAYYCAVIIRIWMHII